MTTPRWSFSIANLQVLRQKSASLCWMNAIDFSLYCHWRDRRKCVFCFCLCSPFQVWPLMAYSEIWKIKFCRIQAVASKIFVIWVLRGVTSWNQQPHNLFCSLIDQERKQLRMSRGKKITILRYWGEESSLVQSMLELEKRNRGTTTEERWHFKMRGQRSATGWGREQDLFSTKDGRHQWNSLVQGPQKNTQWNSLVQGPQKEFTVKLPGPGSTKGIHSETPWSRVPRKDTQWNTKVCCP